MLKGVRTWLRRRSARKEAKRRLQSLASSVQLSPPPDEPSPTRQFASLRAELDKAVEEKRKARLTASRLNLSLKDKDPL